jgi:DNA polymerase-3 subunit epsilon
VTWWTGSAVGFDLETDSPEPTDARIITAATVQIHPGATPVELEVMAKPERLIPEGASAIHGISTERAAAEGIEREAALRVVVEQLSMAGPDRPVVGHNACFDLTILDREMRRTGLGWLETDHLTGFVVMVADAAPIVGRWSFPVVDTLVLDKAVDKFRKGKRQLSVVAEHYGVPMAEGAAHGATADVVASLRIAITIANRCRSALAYIAEHGSVSAPMAFQMHPFMQHYAGRRDPLDIVRAFADAGVLTLPELHAQQVYWAREQADGLREYFVKLNDPEKDPAGVSGEWPLRRLREDETTETISTTVL